MATVQCQKVRGHGHKVMLLVSSKNTNSAVDGHTNFKLGGNYHRVRQHV